MSDAMVLRRPALRLVLAALAVIAAAVGLTIGGCLYINHVAAGVGRVPVLFAPSKTPAAPR